VLVVCVRRSADNLKHNDLSAAYSNTPGTIDADKPQNVLGTRTFLPRRRMADMGSVRIVVTSLPYLARQLRAIFSRLDARVNLHLCNQSFHQLLGRKHPRAGVLQNDSWHGNKPLNGGCD
jgi:hypothetical protein